MSLSPVLSDAIPFHLLSAGAGDPAERSVHVYTDTGYSVVTPAHRLQVTGPRVGFVDFLMAPLAEHAYILSPRLFVAIVLYDVSVTPYGDAEDRSVKYVQLVPPLMEKAPELSYVRAPKMLPESVSKHTDTQFILLS